MKMLVLMILFVQTVWARGPNMNVGDSISYATENLLRRRGELVPPPDIYDLQELNRVLFSENQEQNQELKKVKYYLLNGELRMARLYLTKLTYTRTKLKPVVHRYLAILAFIDGDFEKSYHYISQPELQSLPQFSKICVLKVLNQIVLNKTVDLENDWPRCQVENPGNFREKNLIWLETLIALKLTPKAGITRIPFKAMRLAALDNDELKVMLKLGLYLNQEKLLLNQISELTVDQLQDTDVRELVGQIFFRTGALAQSYRFIEDLKSPNSENIKGNLYVLRNKFELAYAQFKLALEQKQNSQNALERLLPLAWLLGDWENGTKYSRMLIAEPETQIQRQTLEAAFLMQKGEYEKTAQVLQNVAERSRRGAEIEVTQLASFTALMQNQPDIVKKQAALSCSQYDIIQCWVLYQMSQWDSFPLTIRRDEKAIVKRDWERLMSEEINQPLKETVFVNQLDIEELDDKLIQLVPQTTP